MRGNGTNVDLEECTEVVDKECSTLNLTELYVHNCKEDHQCTDLNLLFRCEHGRCWNITSAYSCTWLPEDVEPAVNCAKKRNCLDLHGSYFCATGVCSRIAQWKCERRCVDIPTADKNVLVMSNNRIILANCERAVDTDSGETMWTARDHPDRALLASCTTVTKASNDSSRVRSVRAGGGLVEDGLIRTTDCINGTLLEKSVVEGLTNHSALLRTFYLEGRKHQLDPNNSRRWMPFEEDIVIFEKSKLMINHEGCVNTLQHECAAFYQMVGGDGRNSTSPSRYPCYYDPDNPEFVVLRFDPGKTRWLFFLGFVVPSGLLMISCGILFACSRILSVDTNGRMNLDCCGYSAKATQDKVPPEKPARTGQTTALALKKSRSRDQAGAQAQLTASGTTLTRSGTATAAAAAANLGSKL